MQIILLSGRGLQKDFASYFQRNRINWIITMMILALGYGSQIFVTNARMDTVTMLCDQGSRLNWMDIGRPGLVLTKIIFGLMEFNPYSAGVAFLAAMSVVCLAFGYLFYKVSGDYCERGFILFGALTFLNSMWAEQIFYILQKFEIMCALLFIIGASLFIFIYISDGKRFYNILSIAFMVWGFASYQVFVVYYLAIIMSSFLLLFERVSRTGEDFKFWKIVRKTAITFLIALAIYLIMNKLWFSSSDYLDTLTKDVSHFMLFRNLAAHIVKVLIAYRDVYSIGYSLSLTPIIAVCLYFRKIREIPGFWLFLMVICAFELTPFYMTVILRGTPSFRIQIVLPFVIAFNFYFSYMILCQEGNRKVYLMPLFGLAMFSSVWSQTMNMQRLFIQMIFARWRIPA